MKEEIDELVETLDLIYNSNIGDVTMGLAEAAEQIDIFLNCYDLTAEERKSYSRMAMKKSEFAKLEKYGDMFDLL